MRYFIVFILLFKSFNDILFLFLELLLIDIAFDISGIKSENCCVLLLVLILIL